MSRFSNRPPGEWAALGAVIVVLVVGVASIVYIALTLDEAQNAPTGEPVVGEAGDPTHTPSIITALPRERPLPTLAEVLVDVEALIAQMTVEQKVGQMIMSGVSGETLSENDRQLIETYSIGSIVYFGNNTRSSEQTLQLSQALQNVAAQSGLGIPLLIAVDHEGGEIQRFRQGMTAFPSAMALGASSSSGLTHRVASASAQELLAAGINMSLGPVLDINDQPMNPVIGLRAFGGFPEEVSKLGSSYIDGLQTNRVVATAKHFPGHGSAQVDSHVGLPQIDKTLEQLQQNELVPFSEAVRAQVGVVMTAHIANPSVDPQGRPASLSPIFIQVILRDQMGFQGVVMSDAMSMGAITEIYENSQAALLAIQAGQDLLAYPAPDQAMAAHAVILQAVQSGQISQERLDESVRRILNLKLRFGLFAAPVPQGDPGLPYGDHQQLAALAAQRAIHASGQVSAPLLPEDSVLLVTPDALPVGSVTGDNLSLLGELLQAKGVQVDEWIYSLGDATQAAAVRAEAVRLAPSYPLVILVTWDAALRLNNWGDTTQRDILQALSDTGTPLLLVAAALPYDLALVPETQPALATFGALEIQVAALVDALRSLNLPDGGMPVAIPR